MFTKLYLETTDPELTWNEFFGKKNVFMIIISVIVHTILYTLFCNIVSYIFYNKLLNNDVNMRLIISLLVIMFLGYIGRFIHVKSVYKDFNYNYEKTKQYLNTHYNSWVFIG